ncbi:MAG: YfhO family protein [Flavisolibacter sp.]
MKQGWIKPLLPHLIAVGVFLIVALIYCRPVLQGEVLHQEDVVQWKAMSKNSFDYKEKHGHFPLWTTSMFSGMPAYQIAMETDIPVSPGIFYYIFTLGLPKPISFFFLACICFYFLSQMLRINPYVGIIGSLAYAYLTYNAVLVATGHDTKMQSIALLPAFIGSIMLLYEKRYLWGLAFTALFTTLLVAMNHMQIIYYALIIAVFMAIGYIIYWFRRGDVKHLVLATVLAIAGGTIGVLSNAVTILTTLEASKTTIRGGTELPDKNATKTGLSKDYALSYSMYKTEPFVMMVPKMYGGSDGMEIDQENSKAVEQLQQMPQQVAQYLQYGLHYYWGGIGGTQGPPYVGAIICFLTLIGFFILDNKYKWWILSASVLAIVMSWGEYFSGFSTFLLNNLPMYNKFRAPSMTIVIPSFLFCLMAMLTLQKIIVFDKGQELWDRYKKGLILTAGVFVVLLLIYLSSDFTSTNDKTFLEQAAGYGNQVSDYAKNFMNALKEDRRSLFSGSLLRSFLFIAAAAFLLWMVVRQKMKTWLAYAIIGVLAFIDIMGVDVKYLNADNYQEEQEYNNNFTATPADQQILQDKSYYRVLDLRQGINTLNYGAMTAYYHNSIGGYHPAKLSIYQDLIERQLNKFPQSMPVVNMLNTKYIIQADQSGKESVYTNLEALGPAWFVKAVRYEQTPDAVMNALTNFHPKDTAILFSKDQPLVSYTPSADSSGSIHLDKQDNDEITYTSDAPVNRFAVFSEIYYDRGWKAYVDGKETPILRTNYVLRGLSVPAGHHSIRFVFHPASFYTGKTIALLAGIVVLLLIIGAIVQTWRKRTLETGGKTKA